MIYLDFTQGDLEMKKENKKLAQVRRAKQRKKQKIKSIVAKVLQITIPSVVFLAIVVIALTDPFAKEDTSDSGTSTDTSAEASTSDTSVSEASTSLKTDPTLEVKDGSMISIDYVGTIDGKEFENTQGYGTDLIIGSGNFIDDFEQQLIGAHPGDTVEVNATFPEDYSKEDLRGKDAVFQVVINGIYDY